MKKTTKQILINIEKTGRGKNARDEANRFSWKETTRKGAV